MPPEKHSRTWVRVHLVSLTLFYVSLFAWLGIAVYFHVTEDALMRNLMLGALIVDGFFLLGVPAAAFRWFIRPVCPECGGALEVACQDPVMYFCRNCRHTRTTKVRIEYKAVFGSSDLD